MHLRSLITTASVLLFYHPRVRLCLSNSNMFTKVGYRFCFYSEHIARDGEQAGGILDIFNINLPCRYSYELLWCCDSNDNTRFGAL